MDIFETNSISNPENETIVRKVRQNCRGGGTLCVSDYLEAHWFMHELAAAHFASRAKWFVFYPTLVLTAATSACGFVSTAYSSELFTNLVSCLVSRDLVFSSSLVSGLLAIAVTVLSALGKHWNYQSQADAHLAARRGISILRDEIHTNYTATMTSKQMATLNQELKKGFRAVKESCAAFPLPYEIQRPFTQLHRELDPAPGKIVVCVAPHLYNALKNKISSHRSFPLWLPRIDLDEFLVEMKYQDRATARELDATPKGFQRATIAYDEKETEKEAAEQEVATVETV